MLFRPTYVFDKVKDIEPEFLKVRGIKALLLDLDSTLTTHNNPTPPQDSLDWIKKMKDAGIIMMIVSNNRAERVIPFAEKLDLPFTDRGLKPLPRGYIQAVKKLGLKKNQVAAVGDQIFTDVLGANLMGIRSFFVFPIEPETSLPFKFKRMCEKPFLPKKLTNHRGIK
ncbi:MAG: YqeG family HAD IIIA-type phosphatase [Oscillospiraceae bacterium]|nr:YqeG family HAD IIIA-type phosphatase [Oscillospiraceae bacterium]